MACVSCYKPLPNGEHLPRVYDEVFEQAELAERLGFDAFFVPAPHRHIGTLQCIELLGSKVLPRFRE